MAIISISRGCYSHGKAIAEKVAQKLGYECVNREILLEAVHYFNVSEKKLLQSLENAPGFIEKLTHGKEKYLSYFRAALLEHVKKDNVVYHGHAGHLLIPPVNHLLKVRIIANMDLRVANLIKAEDLLPDEARNRVMEEDRKRWEWTKLIYNKDLRDPSLYDLVIHIDTLSMDDACELICATVQQPSFEAQPEDVRLLNDTAISTHVHAALQDICDAEVTSYDGNVKILVSTERMRITGFENLKIQRRIDKKLKNQFADQILDIAHKVPGVRYAVCDIE